MQEKNFTQEEIKSMTLCERILRISNELDVVKDGHNDFSNYDYIRPDDLQNALKPLLLKYMTFYHFNVIKDDVSNENIAVLTVRKVESNDEEFEYSMKVSDIAIKGANVVQSAGGLRTYCKRYLCMDCFFISDNSDDLDNNKQTESKPVAQPIIPSPPTNELTLLLRKAKVLAGEKNKINSEATLAIVKKYAPSAKINDITDIEVLNNLMNELEGVK